MQNTSSRNSSFATLVLAAGLFLIVGCATKNYVKQSITPVDQKIDQVDKSSQSRDSSQVADINKTNQVVDEDEKKLSATDEIAKTADSDPAGEKLGQECRESGGPWRRKNRPPEIYLRKRSEQERFVGYRRDVHRGAICTSSASGSG